MFGHSFKEMTSLYFPCAFQIIKVALKAICKIKSSTFFRESIRFLYCLSFIFKVTSANIFSK